MKPIEFPGVNTVYAKDQPQYLPLPVMHLQDKQGTVYSCWELTDEEVEKIVKNRHIFLKQLTYGQPLQPILPIAELGDDMEFIE